MHAGPRAESVPGSGAGPCDTGAGDTGAGCAGEGGCAAAQGGQGFNGDPLPVATRNSCLRASGG
eukprot:39278-Chlamydomonas_euryale.AAC.1